MNLIGLDIGTTGCKAMIFSPDGEVISSGFKEYEIEYDGSGKAEQDAEKIWHIVIDVLKQAVNNSKKEKIAAIGISVQGDAIIPVDKDFNPIYNAILGMDYRSAPFARKCDNIFGPKKLFEITGMRSHPINSLTKVLWFKANNPGLYKKTYKIMTYADFITGKLCGIKDPLIDFTMASRTMAFDLNRRIWSDYILDRLDIDKNIFSTTAPSGIPSGNISKKVALKAGLKEDVIVSTGGHDQTCAAIGAGVIKEGIGLISTGTAEVMSGCFGVPLLNDIMFECFYPCYIHAKEDMFFTFSLNHVGGLLLKWFRDNFAQIDIKSANKQKINPYKYLDERIAGKLSSIMFLPHLNGSGTPICDLNSKGAIVGLKISDTKYDIYRAILESQSYELKTNMKAFDKAGVKISSINSVGGGAKSPVWLQIKADILNRKIHTLKIEEAACLGAAVLAGSAAGIYSSVEEGVNKTVKLKHTYEPNDKLSELYKQKYEIYEKIYPALRDINHSL